MTGAAMDAAVAATPESAGAYTAEPHKLAAKPTWTPDPTAGDAAGAAAAIAANGPDATVPHAGTIADPNPSMGDTEIQNYYNCYVAIDWCAGGRYDPARPPRAPGTLPEDPDNPGHPDPGAPAGPQYVPPPSFVMPTCIGATVAVCSSLLDALGATGARTYVPETTPGADITKPAGAIVTQQTAIGATVPLTQPLTFTRNPDAGSMPIELLKPGRNESYADYITRLQTAGWVGTVTYVDLTDTTMDTDVGPQAVSRIRLTTAGTGALELPTYPWPYGPPHPTPLPSPLPTPAPPPRILPSTPLTIVRNPVTAPTPVAPPSPGATPQPIPPGAPSAPGADTPPGDGSPGTGDATCPCNVRAIDWGPLEAITVGTAFPFGLWTWLSNGIAGWGSSTGAPVFDLPLYGAGAGKHVHVDLAPLGDIAALWRAALALLVTILAIWNFTSRQAGDGEGEGL
jgi:hypothetical protein